MCQVNIYIPVLTLENNLQTLYKLEAKTINTPQQQMARDKTLWLRDRPS